MLNSAMAIEHLIHSCGSFNQLASAAYNCMAAIDGSEAQSQAGLSVLRRLRELADDKQRYPVEQAIEVMGKFPNFARPRAAVAIKALKSFSNED